MKTKICSKCGEEKELSEFHGSKTSCDGVRTRCKVCAIKYQKIYDSTRKPERKIYQKKYAAQYNIDNKEIVSERNKIFYENNKEYFTEYRKDNAEHITENHQQWREDNPERCSEYKAIRRGFGIPLAINKKFKGSEEHHLHILDEETGIVNTQITIHIPEELHKSVWHSRHRPDLMLVINELAMEWYYNHGYKLQVD